ncbi:MAG TPA: hypothetical protein ENK18_24830 [Deltaproteobacteria bacterium]|nr:hypothetical protein [Deltaproteobacteria bacterium]
MEEHEQTSVTEVTVAATEAVISTSPHQVGAFSGVFAPTILSILGVVLYLRLGWVVGNAGLGGALLICSLALLISICTGLSLSSIASNTRLGDGGTFSILTRSLGFEVSGVIGVPLFLTRPLSVAMYIFGFREGLMWLTEDVSALSLDLGIFFVLFAIAYRGARLASSLQWLVLLIIGASLCSVVLAGPNDDSPFEIVWWGSFEGSVETGLKGTDFWGVFAVFLPATTGFLAGSPTRVELADPRRTVPLGTMAAISVSALLYLSIVVWCARVGALEDLTADYGFLIDHAVSPVLVVLGLLGACASSALAGLISAPGILTALGNNRLVPFSEAMGETVHGEPRNAMVLTGMLTLACLAVRDINAIAPLVSLLFLVTYATINLALIIEGGLGLVTFRPIFQVPAIVPAIGLSASIVSMFMISPLFGLAAVASMALIVLHVRRVGVPGGSDQARSSVFVAAAEWAASQITQADLDNPRAWKPNLLVPVVDAEQLRDSYRLLMDLAQPDGSIRLLGLAAEQPAAELGRRLARLSDAMGERGVRATWSMIDLDEYPKALAVGTQAFQGAFLRPNMVFLRLDRQRGVRLQASLGTRVAVELGQGIVLFMPDAEQGLGELADIRLWVRRGPRGWSPEHALAQGNLDLALLLGLRLARRWGGRITLATVSSPAEEPSATAFLDALCDLARFPSETERVVFQGEEAKSVADAIPVDLSIFGFPGGVPDLGWAEGIKLVSRGSCLFVCGSGSESVQA